MNLAKFSIAITLVLVSCKTGSEYERQIVNIQARAQEQLPRAKAIISVGNFSFENQEFAQDSYKKGMWLPGYLGIDVESFGPFPEEAKKKGLKSVYDYPKFGEEFAAFVREKQADSELQHSTKVTIDGKFISTVMAVRFHTYGCWPFVGTIAYIFNAESFTIINSTRIRYRMQKAGSPPIESDLIIATPKEFRYWESLVRYKLGMDVGQMQAAALELHVSELRQALYRKILESL